MCWKILALLLVGTFVSYTVATDFDEDDDEGNGVVEDEPEIAEPVVMEKVRLLMVMSQAYEQDKFSESVPLDMKKIDVKLSENMINNEC